MHFDELVRLLIRTACNRGQEEGAKAACSSKRPSAKITLDTPNGGTITVDLGVAVSGWALLGLGIVAMIVLKCLGRVQFDFGRAGHRLGRGQRPDLVDDQKDLPSRLIMTASAPPTRPASLPLPQGPSWPVAAPRDLQVGAVSGRPRVGSGSSMKSVASALESTC